MVGLTPFDGGACGALTEGLEVGPLLAGFGEQEAMSAVAASAAATNVRSVRTRGRVNGRSVRRLERAMRFMGITLIDACSAVIDATGQVLYRVAARSLVLEDLGDRVLQGVGIGAEDRLDTVPD